MLSMVWCKRCGSITVITSSGLTMNRNPLFPLDAVLSTFFPPNCLLHDNICAWDGKWLMEEDIKEQWCEPADSQGKKKKEKRRMISMAQRMAEDLEFPIYLATMWLCASLFYYEWRFSTLSSMPSAWLTHFSVKKLCWDQLNNGSSLVCFVFKRSAHLNGLDHLI